MHLAIVTPVFEDWEALEHLIRDIAELRSGDYVRVRLIAVDDGSANAIDVQHIELPDPSIIDTIEILHLALNLGHQRAIAVGLSEVCKHNDIDAVLTMDSDGEDKVSDVPLLLSAYRASPNKIVAAARVKRSERSWFKLGYLLYKVFFRVLTGQSVNFGNFCLFPITAVRRLVFMPELWNNLPGCVIRSRLGLLEVPTARGRRYLGFSKMKLMGLISHGLGAMSVHVDVIFVRILMGATVIGILTLIGIFVAVVVRLTTTLAIPGWTTNMVGALLIILMQAILLIVSTALIVLAGRSQRPIIPLLDSGSFVVRRQSRICAAPAQNLSLRRDNVK
jgi:hypothetical protein